MPRLMAETLQRPETWHQVTQDVRETTRELIDAARERHALTEKLLVLVGSGSADDAVVRPPLVEGLHTHLLASRQGMSRVESYMVAMDSPAVAFERLKQPLMDFHNVDDHAGYVLAEQEADACLQLGLMELTERWQQDESEVDRQLRLLLDSLDCA